MENNLNPQPVCSQPLPNTPRLPHRMYPHYHRKYNSCDSSPHPSLKVTKQPLAQRRQAAKGGEHMTKLIRKDKTVCFNLAYMKLLNERKTAVNWVKYNMAVGIFLLWGRLKQQLAPYFKLSLFRKLQPQIQELNREVDRLMHRYCYRPSQKNKEFSFLNAEKDKVHIRKNLMKNNDFSSKQDVRVSLQVSKEGEVQVEKNEEKTLMQSLQSSIRAVNSAFCLVDRSITLKKENKLISDFLEAKRSSNGKLTPQQKQELHQILQINDRRCELMSQLANHISQIEGNQLIPLNPEQIKKIQQINIAHLASEEKVQQAISKEISTIVVILSQSEHTQPHNSKQPGLLKPETKKKVENKKVPINRASIESSLSPTENSYNHVTSKVSQLWRQPNDLTAKMKAAKAERQQAKKQQQKLAFKMKEISMESKLFHGSKKVVPELRNKKLRRAIAFASDLEEDDQMKELLQSCKKSMSMKSLKSKKELSWEQIDLDGIRGKYMKTLRSLKSLKSIGSLPSGNSGKYLRSMKTQRELKYLHGIRRQISCIRNYRSKIFKLKGEPQQVKPPSHREDCLNLTSEISIPSARRLTSLNRLVSPSPSPSNSPTHSQSSATHSQLIDPTSPRLDTQTSQISGFNRTSQRSRRVIGHPNEKSNIIRQFLGLFKQIEGEKSVVKRKELIVQQLNRLIENQMISPNDYQRYKMLIAPTIKQEKIVTCPQEEPKKEHPNLYKNLLEMRKVMQLSSKLNQTNKYYYNFNQFSTEEEQINKTKTIKRKDEELFNIRMTLHRRTPSPSALLTPCLPPPINPLGQSAL